MKVHLQDQSDCCDHQSSLNSNIFYCQNSKVIKPKARDLSPKYTEQSNCENHNKKYERVCIQCEILLCRECLMLTHPYDHKIIPINTFVKQIMKWNNQQNLKYTPKKSQFQNKIDHKGLFQNRQIISALSDRLKILNYKKRQISEKKLQVVSQLEQLKKYYEKMIENLYKTIQQISEKISKLFIDAHENIAEFYDGISLSTDKESQCLQYCIGQQSIDEIGIAQFMLKNWNSVQASLRQSGMNTSFHCLFQLPRSKRIDKGCNYSHNYHEQIDKICEKTKNRVRKQIEKLSELLIASLKDNDSNNKSTSTLMTGYNQNTQQKAKIPGKDIKKALNNIISHKKCQNIASNNKQNFTPKINTAKKCDKLLSSTKVSTFVIDQVSKRSYNEYDIIDQQFIFYGGAGNKQLFQVYNPIQSCKSFEQAKFFDGNPSFIGTQHQQFAIAPSSYNNCFYTFGGRMHGQPIDCIFSVVYPYKRELIGHLACARTSSGSTYTIQKNQKHSKIKIFIAGGLNQYGESLRTCQLIQIQERNTEFQKHNIKKYKLPSMKNRRHLFSISIYKGYLYAIGGINQQKTTLSSVQRINLQNDPENKNWEHVANLQEQRSMHSSISTNDGLFVIGGKNQQCYLNSIEKYNPIKNSFTTILHLKEYRSLFGLSSCCNNSKIIIFGGYNGQQILDNCEMIDLKKMKCTMCTHKMNECRYGFGCISAKI